MNKTIIAVLSVLVTGLSGWLAVSVATNATVEENSTSAATEQCDTVQTPVITESEKEAAEVSGI